VAVESLYSMDGDLAPLEMFADICRKHSAELIVDEAHSTGVYGPDGSGLVNELGLQNFVVARVHTFGKALGAHGAAVTGSSALVNFLVNFARSFIYTTALPPGSFAAIKSAHELLPLLDRERASLTSNISRFRDELSARGLVQRVPASISHIQSVAIPGNAAAKAASLFLRKQGFDARAILSPTVARGSERLRISLHSFNTESEICGLASGLEKALHA